MASNGVKQEKTASVKAEESADDTQVKVEEEENKDSVKAESDDAAAVKTEEQKTRDVKQEKNGRVKAEIVVNGVKMEEKIKKQEMDGVQSAVGVAGTIDVWKENEGNVFLIEPYHYFKCTSEINNASGRGVAGMEDSEAKASEDRHLAQSTTVLKHVHEEFYAGHETGMRGMTAEEQMAGNGRDVKAILSARLGTQKHVQDIDDAFLRLMEAEERENEEEEKRIHLSTNIKDQLFSRRMKESKRSLESDPSAAKPGEKRMRVTPSEPTNGEAENEEGTMKRCIVFLRWLAARCILTTSYRIDRSWMTSKLISWEIYEACTDLLPSSIAIRPVLYKEKEVTPKYQPTLSLLSRPKLPIRVYCTPEGERVLPS
ncbi:hypothetical protein AM588_10003704 [Phytophthora nicotianae]|uniref:protein-serine/threonine phosphatase n=1 Tax=Phytophthora nicotianae TaxID=4792 RepID=A0A0W8CSM1_PHYNI|nr:hypothetical protein AM588_10003704 [Phytophthora nicotianae]